MHLFRQSAIPLCFLLVAPAISADMEDGKKLHGENCIACHLVDDHSALYTRENRKVDSLHKLGGQVSACTQQLEITWFPEEQQNVVNYLNETYYKFPKGSE